MVGSSASPLNTFPSHLSVVWLCGKVFFPVKLIKGPFLFGVFYFVIIPLHKQQLIVADREYTLTASGWTTQTHTGKM